MLGNQKPQFGHLTPNVSGNADRRSKSPTRPSRFGRYGIRSDLGCFVEGVRSDQFAPDARIRRSPEKRWNLASISTLRACEAQNWAREWVSATTCPAFLVITLLNGGCGHEDLRRFPPVSVPRSVSTASSTLFTQAERVEPSTSWPPYNIEKVGRRPVSHHHGGRGLYPRRDRTHPA